MSRFHCFSMSCWHTHQPHSTMEVVNTYDIVHILHLCKAFTTKFLTNSLHISFVSCIRWPKLWKTYIFFAYSKWIYWICVQNHLLRKNFHNGFFHKIHFHFTSSKNLCLCDSHHFYFLQFSWRVRINTFPFWHEWSSFFIFQFSFHSFIPFCTFMSWKNNSWTLFFFFRLMTYPNANNV